MRREKKPNKMKIKNKTKTIQDIEQCLSFIIKPHPNGHECGNLKVQIWCKSIKIKKLLKERPSFQVNSKLQRYCFGAKRNHTFRLHSNCFEWHHCV